jgi:hypothetical protein
MNNMRKTWTTKGKKQTKVEITNSRRKMLTIRNKHKKQEKNTNNEMWM